MNNKEQIIRSFNHADSYDLYAYIQKIIAHKVAFYIQETYKTLEDPKVILEIGCGTGFLTQHLIDLFPNAHFIISDIAPNMIERVKNKFNNSSAFIEFRVLDADYMQIDEQFDLVCSSLSLQWVSDLALTLKGIEKSIKPNGFLIFSTLEEKTFLEWQDIYNKNNYPYSFQRYLSLSELEKCWPNGGCGWWESEAIIDSQSNGFDFLKGLHKIGANIAPSNHQPLSSKQLKKVIEQYEKKYGYTTYQVAFGFFRKFVAKGFFITGTDTDIGKTFVSACMVKALNAIYWKPIQTGLNNDQGDTKTVQQLTRLPLDQFMMPLIELQAPLSPEDAATLEGKILTINDLDISSIQNVKSFVIEGAGGIYVPITDQIYMLDLIKKINLPIIIVARSGLGTLNHTLMTIKLLQQHRIFVAGVVLNGDYNKLNKEAIERHTDISVIAEIPRLDNVSVEGIDECISLLKISLKSFIN